MKEFIVYPKTSVWLGYNSTRALVNAIMLDPLNVGNWSSIEDFNKQVATANIVHNMPYPGAKMDESFPTLSILVDNLIYLGAKELLEIINDRHALMPGCGICFEIMIPIVGYLFDTSSDSGKGYRKAFREILYDRLAYLFSLDENWSGEWRFPVKAPKNTPEEFYQYENPAEKAYSECRLWEGEYGKARKTALENLLKRTSF